jgi:predicted transcriptional regulator
MKYRDKIELIALILIIVSRRNVGAAHIMYKAFLSYTQMKKYVSILIAAGLIKYQEGNLRTYRITERGIRFLCLYNAIAELLSAPTPSSNTIIMI